MSKGIFLKLLLFFSATQALGLFVASKTFQSEPGLIEPVPMADFSLYDVFIIVAILALFIFITTRYYRLAYWIFNVFLFLFIFSGTQVLLEIWLDPFVAVWLSLIVAGIIKSVGNVLFQNIGMILALSGIGAIMGLSMTPIMVIFLLIILTFYDIFSVYRSGHMIKMASSMISSRSIFGFVIPETFGQINSKLGSIKFEAGSGFMLLGSGDVILPLLLAVSIIPISFVSAIFVAIFSLLGLMLMYYLFSIQKVHKPMAALPPIATMAIIGYLLTQILLVK